VNTKSLLTGLAFVSASALLSEQPASALPCTKFLNGGKPGVWQIYNQCDECKTAVVEFTSVSGKRRSQWDVPAHDDVEFQNAGPNMSIIDEFTCAGPPRTGEQPQSSALLDDAEAQPTSSMPMSNPRLALVTADSTGN
jgi:hypothetical protein